MAHLSASYRRPALALALLVIPWVSSWGAPPANLPEIEYAAPNQSVWTTRSNGKGEPDNPLFRVADVLFAKAGIAWHGRSYPAARMFQYLQDGTAQFSILVQSTPLQDCCLLSHKPITAVEIRIYHRTDTPPINRLDDLVGQKIITIHGYSYGGLLSFFEDGRRRINNNVAISHHAAFRMLSRQRADYVVDYAGPASEVLAAEPQPGLHWEVLSRQDVHLVLVRSYPDAAAVMARLEGIAHTLEIDKIMQGTQK